MANHKIITGLEIGTSKICCLIAEVSEDQKIEILGKGFCASRGVKKGVITDIEEAIKSIEAAVLEAEKMAGFDICPVYVGVKGEYIASINSCAAVAVASPERLINEVDLKRAVDAAKNINLPKDRSIVHVIPIGYVIDGHNGVKNPVGMYGEKLEVQTHIVTGVTTFLQNIKKCIKLSDLELEPEGFVLESIAAGKAATTLQERESGTILIDIGGGTTDFVLFKDGNVYMTGVLPVGGNHITYDIAVALKIPLVEAERLKVSYGQAKSTSVCEDEKLEVVSFSQKGQAYVSRKFLCQIVEARLSEIFELIKKQIEFAALGGTYLVGATLTGGTALCKNITELASDILQVPARIGYSDNLDGLVDIVKGPEFCTSVGLILCGRERNRNDEKRNKPLKSKTYIQKAVHWLSEVF